VLNSDSGNIALLPGPPSAKLTRPVDAQAASPDAANSNYGTRASADANQGRDSQGSSPSSPQSRGRNYSTNPQTNAGGGSIDFAGSDQANDSGYKSRVGPLERDRQQRTTGGSGSGLKTRIIPSGSAINSGSDPNAGSVDQDDQGQDRQSTSSNRPSGQP